MSKERLIAVFSLAALLLVGGLTASTFHQALAANGTPVQAVTAVQSHGIATPVTAVAATTNAAQAESESETEAPESASDAAADTDNIQQQDGPQDGPQDDP